MLVVLGLPLLVTQQRLLRRLECLMALVLTEQDLTHLVKQLLLLIQAGLLAHMMQPLGREAELIVLITHGARLLLRLDPHKD